MEQCNILCLYTDLLDLYGDIANIVLIKKRLEQMNIKVNVIQKSIEDDIDYKDIKLVYIGPGKMKNLAVASEHFIKFKDKTFEAIENGINFLITGNARLLFGKEFTLTDGEKFSGIGFFDYTARDTNGVFISDNVSCVYNNTDYKCYGFINRTAHIENMRNTQPLFRLICGAGDGVEDSEYEGNYYKNYIGTWQLGPIMVKNPMFLRGFLSRLYPNAEQSFDDSLEKKAIELTLNEFPQTTFKTIK